MDIKNFKNTSLIFFISLFISYFINVIFFYSPQNIPFRNIQINGLEVLKEILFKNIICFIWILLALILGKMVIAIFLIMNGAILGTFISKLSSIKYILAIIPHGITEIFSFILVCSIVLTVLENERLNLKNIKLIIFAFFILIFSAILESFLTPMIIQKFVL
ncbi:TPA: hypothetical protein I9007_002661 [Clostridium perfringens]|uniref:stage II sporulation protein M n=1 Tax=Clostridium perfringens TaxID=1502 RepID=UPI001A292B54|nr:stage II sporulation protein M [Clostridium perfringens]WFB45056.1 stage II sporulation protein M [Clostridium perfringens]WFD76625.1 stage II sporulation protein M [Clostridium perfringens]WFD85170.1 stage II sporulation protein M [Clostridium perfringens]WFD97987.1 stage II sporulation protein M [Clostridium perfringens]HAT4187040.1 hypothetical protein [Clostridium perfringens]